MTYNSEVVHEQGGSVLRIDSTGSISLQAGGTIAKAILKSMETQEGERA